jgi:hypothetical protein
MNCSNANLTVSSGDDGAAVYVHHAEAKCTCRYYTVAFYADTTGIDSKAAVAPLIEFCSVYDNLLSDRAISQTICVTFLRSRAVRVRLLRLRNAISRGVRRF